LSLDLQPQFSTKIKELVKEPTLNRRGFQIKMTNAGRFFDFLLFNFKEPYGVTKSKNRPTLVISQVTETGNLLTPV
jgi:hypothetical protein